MAQTHVVRGVATKVVRDPCHTDTVVCTYHDTVVARKEGRLVRLDSGGYRTATTKLRMNQFANEYCNSWFNVCQKGGKWYVHIPYRNYPNDTVLEFYDGMEFEV